jgi:hypothetical protein
MTTRELYLRVLATCEMSESDFLIYLGDVVRSLLALYPTALLCRAGDAIIGPPASLDEESGLDPLYDGALVAGVVACKTGDSGARATFLSEAEHAFRKLWRAAARRRRDRKGEAG